MPKNRPPVTPTTLRNSFDRRSIVVGGLQIGLGTLLAGRLAWIAIAENEQYELKSEGNRVNLSLIPPRRGWILDRYEAPLASNRADFRIDIIPERLKNPTGTINELGKLLNLSTIEIEELTDKVENARGFRPIEVASRLTWDRFAAISVRLPDLPGVVPQRGYSRQYPTGPSVGHLLGYVGTANAAEYEKDKNPLLITPGYKIGKDGLEKQFEENLRGTPGARRTEVTARGKIVRDLETREDVPGKPVKLTIDGPLQDYAARRLGLESGAVVVMDCENGDILCASSMPSFDPNSFSDGIKRVEWRMLREDDHVPLRNKVLRGLYPPGSTVKPMVALAFLEAGLSPNQTAHCGGGLRVGNRVFHCHKRRGHGSVNMDQAIAQSCDVYFYHFAQILGMDIIAQMAHRLGLGEEFDLPVNGQSYGTVPDPAWKKRKYGQNWAAFDTVNATIGQGYMLANPLQQAVMAARIGSGLNLQPRLLFDNALPKAESLGIPQDHLDYVHQAMSNVINGAGTARRAKLPIPDILMAGKTGTAQVVSLNISNGKSGPWKYRDHGHFICFAPFDKPKYACAVTVEHGGGSGSAYPIARDVMTFLFDPAKAMQSLEEVEKGWGGTPQQRMSAKYKAFSAQSAVKSPSVEQDVDKIQRENAAPPTASPPQPIVQAAQTPRDDTVDESPSSTTAPTAPLNP